MIREDKKGTVTEQEQVVYAGAVLIPFCVGSVALPLSLCRAPFSPTPSAAPPVASGKLKQRRRVKNGNAQGGAFSKKDDVDNSHDYNAGTSRCTHVRYTYLRDGSCAGLDLAYRRAQCTDGGVRAVSSNKGEQEAMVASSASSLYAFLDHVVFKLPNSFPEPYRVLTQPPFFIVDDTWAEHTVEMEIHFRPWLDIAPFTVTHMVLLQKRADIPPGLLSSTFGQDKPPPIVILTPTNPVLSSSSLLKSAAASKPPLKRRSSSRSMDRPTAHDGDDNHNDGAEELSGGEHGICVGLEDLEDIPVVSERRDSIRIFHPSLNVVRYLNMVRARPQPELEPPPSFCVLPMRKAAFVNAHVENHSNPSEDPNHHHHHQDHHGSEKRRRINDNGAENYLKVRNGTLLPTWCFPFEAIVHAHEPKRQDGAVLAMRGVLEALQKEQAELREGIEQKIGSAMAAAEELRGIIQRMRETCASLGRLGGQ